MEREDMEYSLSRIVIIMLLFLLIYGASLLPPVLFTYYLSPPIYLLPFVLVLDFYLFVFSAVFLTGGIVRLLRIKYKEGEYRLTLKNPQVFKWVLFQTLYFPIAMLLYLLHAYALKEIHIKLCGAKVGKGVTIGGLITDPCLFEVGDYTIIGGLCTILSHSGERGKVIFKKVKIGKRCLVGENSTILCGAKMEDGSILGASSLLPKNKVLKAGKVYGGVPARKIK